MPCCGGTNDNPFFAIVRADEPTMFHPLRSLRPLITVIQDHFILNGFVRLNVPRVYTIIVVNDSIVAFYYYYPRSPIGRWTA
jgi:hypothetical protein